MPDPLGANNFPPVIHNRAQVDGVMQTMPDGSRRWYSAEELEATMDLYFVEKTEPLYSYFKPTRSQRIRREIVRRFHMAMAWVHDRLFSAYCDYNGCRC